MTARPESMVVMDDHAYATIFDTSRRERLAGLTSLGTPVHTTELESPAARSRLPEVSVLVTGWGCPPLTAEILSAAPELRAVFHAAGSIRHHITAACWERGLLVTTAAQANALPVAEYTLAAILAAGKRLPLFVAEFRGSPGGYGAWRDAVRSPSNYGKTVGIVGLSRIGRRVAGLLQSFDLRVLAADPYAAADDATELGVALVDLDALLAESDIVSLHAPELPATRHLLDARRLSLLRDGGTVINTSRGSLVDTAALTAECVTGRLDAVLDVTEPEPLPADSPLYQLPNVVLTPHVAGAMGTETLRLTDAALDELERYVTGRDLQHRVVEADLATMA